MCLEKLSVSMCPSIIPPKDHEELPHQPDVLCSVSPKVGRNCYNYFFILEDNEEYHLVLVFVYNLNCPVKISQSLNIAILVKSS